MPVIDADGYFGGDRFDMVSDAARLAWPSFWCASNSLGRLELNYHKIIAKAFSRYKQPPTLKEVFGWLREYRDAYLLYIYEARGTHWGQWDTSERWLPRHKLSVDITTPAPNAKDFAAWKDQYSALKRAKSNSVNDFINPSETFLLGGGIGVGVGVGVGEGKYFRSPAGPASLNHPANGHKAESSERGTGELVRGSPDEQAPEPSRGCAVESPKQAAEKWFDEKFWPHYPRKVGKAAAKRVFARKGSTAEKCKRICEALEQQLPGLLAREMQYRPHAVTWLNQERYGDDPEVYVEQFAEDGEVHY